MSEFPPLIYVDLIEEKPKSIETRPSWYPEGEKRQAEYQKYLDGFQPWRIAIKSGDNRKALFRSTERYFNKADALHAIQLAFGTGSNVYLRQKEHGDVPLRMAVPNAE